MIVDDAPDSSEPLKRFLEKMGHQVTCYTSATDAFAAVLNKKPDVVVLDLLMPGIDGSSFLETIRSYLKLRTLPVVVWTGLSDHPIVEEARAAGANSILLKGKATFAEIEHALDEALVSSPLMSRAPTMDCVVD